MSFYVLQLLRRSLRLFFALAKIMLPIMLLVQFGQWLGWVDALGHFFGPVMAWLNLPAQVALIWMASIFVDVYGTLAALASLAVGLDMTASQFSSLASMVFVRL